MNPGEYEVDGVRYGWAHDLDEYEHRERIDGVWFRCARFPDIEKAEKARHELAEAESVEWVEWTWAGGMCRASADGSRVQMWDYCSEKWVDATESRTGAAYRKGRGVAEAEQAELRDAVRELVEAVNIYDRYLKRHGSASRNDLIIAAKKVEAKL